MKIVIFGANEVGCLLATQLFEDHDIIVIDKEENRIDDFKKLDIEFIFGNASNIDVLEKINIKDADVFIACTAMDEANIVACLTVKRMSMAKTACFVSKEEYIESLGLIKGSEYHSEMMIDSVIWPEALLTQEIFRIITVPDAIDVENFAQGKARLLEYRIKNESSLLGKQIKDCSFPDETLVVGITRNNELFIPSGLTVFEEGDKVIFMGAATSLDILAREMFSESEKIKSVGIIGGGNVGLMLAKDLEKANIRTKIIEKNYKRCEFLTENLKKTLILNGDGTDLELLQQEEFNEFDVLVSVTNNDEKNLLCSLLAKQLGVKKVITRVSKSSNIALFEKVGIDVAMSPKEAAIDEINNVLIETDIDILATVEQGQGEVIDIYIPENYKDTKVMDLRLPQKAIIGIIRRGSKVIIPKGDTLVRARDSLIVFTMAEHSSAVKDYFCKG